MNCSRCETPNQEDAAFCFQCGSSLPHTQSPPGAPAQTLASRDELASMGQRMGSFLVHGILEAIPYVGFVVQIINWIMFRRGHTIGLRLAGARTVRENGDVSGFFHTSVRAYASILSAIPLGLGFWWAFRDPWRQTWHDKLLHTYVVRDSMELAYRPGTSSSAAVTWFWGLLVASVVVGIVVSFIAA